MGVLQHFAGMGIYKGYLSGTAFFQDTQLQDRKATERSRMGLVSRKTMRVRVHGRDDVIKKFW